VSKIIHLTDPHLSKPGLPLKGLNPHERLEATFRDINEFHADADACIISGDLTDSSSPEALLWLKEFLARFPISTHLIIGNHDERSVFFNIFDAYKKDKNGFLQYSFELGADRFLCLDTKKDEPVPSGEYCEKRMAWLNNELNKSNADTYIFMHHPPFDVGVPHMDRIKLNEAEAFGALISSHKNVRHIFFGHVHRPVFLTWRGITCSACPGINHQMPLVGRAVSTKFSLEPPMYAVIEIENGNLRINLDAFLDRHPTAQ
jgi:3',5'-cyclic-AMP phosphodiesterase